MLAAPPHVHRSGLVCWKEEFSDSLETLSAAVMKMSSPFHHIPDPTAAAADVAARQTPGMPSYRSAVNVTSEVMMRSPVKNGVNNAF